jgi:hypothetical protein
MMPIRSQRGSPLKPERADVSGFASASLTAIPYRM